MEKDLREHLSRDIDEGVSSVSCSLQKLDTPYLPWNFVTFSLFPDSGDDSVNRPCQLLPSGSACYREWAPLSRFSFAHWWLGFLQDDHPWYIQVLDISAHGMESLRVRLIFSWNVRVSFKRCSTSSRHSLGSSAGNFPFRKPRLADFESVLLVHQLLTLSIRPVISSVRPITT